MDRSTARRTELIKGGVKGNRPDVGGLWRRRGLIIEMLRILKPLCGLFLDI